MKKTALIIAFAIGIVAHAQTDLFNQNITVTTNYNVTNRKTIEIKNSTVRYKNFWAHNQGTSKLTINLENSALYFEKECIIDNNLPDLVNARVPFMYGKDKEKDSVVFLKDFQADYTGFDTTKSPRNQSAWISKGHSVLYVGDVSVVTESSKNHPSIHKKQPNGNYTHHGVLAFVRGQSNWIIREENQWSDAAIYIQKPLDIITHTDLKYIGEYHAPYVNVAFGALTGDTVTIVKKGKAALILAGDQAYTPGSTLNVEEGSVSFYKNPGTTNVSIAKNVGQHLSVNGQQGTKIEIAKEPAWFYKLIIHDSIVLGDKGQVEVKDSLAFSGVLKIKKDFNLPSKAPYFKVNGVAMLGGEVVIEEGLGDSLFLVHSTQSIKGDFNSVSAPYTLVKDGNKVFAVKGSVGIDDLIIKQKISVKKTSSGWYLSFDNDTNYELMIINTKGVKLYSDKGYDQNVFFPRFNQYVIARILIDGKKYTFKLTGVD